MAEGYWNNRQPPLNPSSGGMFKRHRSEYDLPPSGVPSNYEMQTSSARDEYHDGPQIVKDTKSLDSAYDRYLQSRLPSLTSGKVSSYGGVGSGGMMPGLSLADQGIMGRPRAVPDLAPNDRGADFSGQLSGDAMARRGREIPLPPDASNTLYVEGLPPNSSRREVAHIFRPFVGYKEVRIVTKESKQRGGDPLLLCFVDFANPACAATAMSAVQGYIMDEHDPESAYLRLQFSRFPGPRSGPGHRGKR